MTDDRALTPDRTAEYERVLLGCALTAPAVARDLLALVQAPMIADPRLSRAWSALRRVLTDETGPVDLPGAVAAELAGDADEAPSLVDLHSLTAEVLSAANAAWYARRVLDAYVRRTAAGMIGEAEAERNRDNPTAALLAGVEERARHLRGLLAGPGAAAPVLSSAAEYADAPQPAPVLWRDDPAAPDSTDVDAVLSVGECAILASAGGLGKSTLVLEIASAAVAAADFDRASMAACGLAVAAGPVVVVSFEDAPARRPAMGRSVASGARSGRAPGGGRPGERRPGGREHDRDRPGARVPARPDRGGDGRRCGCPAGGARHEGGPRCEPAR